MDEIKLLKSEIDSLQQELAEYSHRAHGWDRYTVFTICGFVLLYSLGTLGFMTYLIGKNHSPAVVMRNFVIPMIVVFTVVLIVAGFDKDQIAPVIGLFGAIIGYLLGKGDKELKALSGELEEAPTPRKKTTKPQVP